MEASQPVYILIALDELFNRCIEAYKIILILSVKFQ